MKKYLLGLIMFTLSFAHLFGQNNSAFDNIILDDSFKNKNLHDVLMDVNASKTIFIAYDVKAAQRIIIPKNYAHQSLAKLLTDVVKIDIKKVEPSKYLIRFDQKATIPIEQNHLISGNIVDENKQPIPYALISTQDHKSNYADENGHFKLQISPKSKLVCVQMLGFKTVCQKISKQIPILNFVLANDPIQLDEILLKRSPVKAKIKEGNFEIQLNKFIQQNALGNDINRTLQIMPSIHSNNDANAEIQFRNTFVEENLVQYEEIPLFMTTHMYGFFSSINHLAVDKISLFPNNVPVQYVSRTGGMVHLENEIIRKNDASPWKFKLDLDFLSGKAAITYKNDKNSFKITGRTSFGSISNENFYSLATQEEFSILKNDTIHPLNPIFQFKDFTLYYKHQFNDIWSLKLSGIHISDYNHYAIQSQIKKPFYKNHILKDSIIVNQSLSETNTQVQNGFGARLHARWNDQWASTIEVITSNLSENNTIQTKAVVKRRKDERTSKEQFDYENNLQFLRIQLLQDYQYFKHQISFGINYEQSETDIIRNFKGKTQRPLDHLINQDTLFTAFAHWKYEFHKKITLQTSFKSTYERKLRSTFYAPNIQLTYTPNSHLSYNISAQSNFQTLRKIYSENPFGKPQSFWTNIYPKKIKPLKSQSIALQINYQNEDWVITNSIYYRQSEGITEWLNTLPSYRKDSIERITGPKLNFYSGQGKGVGYETLLYKRTGNIQTWISYRLSKSIVQFPGLYRGQWVPSSDDQRHNLHFTANYHQKRWQYEFSYQYGSGRRYLDISTFNPNKDRQEIDRKMFKTLPDYHRFDINISYQWKNAFTASNWKITASLFNIFDTSNSYYRQYPLLIPARDGRQQSALTGTDFNQLGRFFDFGVLVGF